MSHDVWSFLRDALRLMADSVTSGASTSSVLTIETCSPTPYNMTVEIRQAVHSPVFEVAITGLAMRGARESLRAAEINGLLASVLERLNFSLSNVNEINVCLVQTSTDKSKYLPAYAGSSRDGQLQTMGESIKLFVESAVAQAISAAGNHQSTELHIAGNKLPKPIVVHMENTAGQKQPGQTDLCVCLTPSCFRLQGSTQEAEAFIMSQLSGQLALETGPRIEIHNHGPRGPLPPIILVPDLAATTPTS